MSTQAATAATTGAAEAPVAKSIREIATRKDQFHVPFSSIEIIEGWNTRDYEAEDTKSHIEWLKNQFFGANAVGIRDAWRGRFDKDLGKFINTDAHCRYLACQKAIKEGLTTGDFSVPVVLEEKAATEAEQLATMLLSNSGLPLKPLEKAFVFRRLNDAGKTDKEVGELANLTRQQVANIKMLAYATEPVLELIRKDEIKTTVVQNEIRSAAGESLEEKGKAAEESILKLVGTAKALGIRATSEVAEQLQTQKKKNAKVAANAAQSKADGEAETGQGTLVDSPDGDAAPTTIRKFTKAEKTIACDLYATLADVLPETEVTPEGTGKNKVACFKMPWKMWQKIETMMP